MRPGPRVRLPVALAILVLGSAPGSATAGELSQTVEFSAGASIPFDSEHRDVYGAGWGVSAGYAYRLTTGDLWLMLDTGYRRASGQEFWVDPTFDLPESKYWVVPLGIGVRANLIPADKRRNLHLYLGGSLQTVITGWQGPFGETARSSALGFAVELRPEFAVHDRWRLWFRDRFSFLSAASFEELVNRINHSGSAIEAGVSYALR